MHICHSLFLLSDPSPGTLSLLLLPFPTPSVLIFRDVRTRAKSVALNVTVPSELRGTFIATSLCKYPRHRTHSGEMLGIFSMTRVETFVDAVTYPSPPKASPFSFPYSIEPSWRSAGKWMGRCTDLAGHSVWAQLSESQWGLDASQQGNDIQVLDAAPGAIREVPLDQQYPLRLFLSPAPIKSLPPKPTPKGFSGKSTGIEDRG